MTVESYFQLRADQFHSLYEEDHPFRYRVNRVVRRAIFERVALTLREFRGRQKFSVLDVGCGSGRNSVAFVNAGASRVVGIDFSERMLELAREFSCSHGAASKCEFVKADFMTHTFDEKFDFVVGLGLFDYVEDAESTLKRMVAMAKYKVIGSFPKPSLIRAPLRKFRYAVRGCPVYFYSRQQLMHICERLGVIHFEVVPCTSAGFLLVLSLEDYPSSPRAAAT